MFLYLNRTNLVMDFTRSLCMSLPDGIRTTFTLEI